jgi:hypothetical protein
MTYEVATIGLAEADRAFPLVAFAADSLSLAAWQDFCSQLGPTSRRPPRPEQVWIVRNPAGRIQGLALSKLGDDPTYGRMLDVPIFVVASAADESGVSGALIGRLRHLAEDSGCKSIRFWTVGGDSWGRHMQASDYQRWDHGVRMMLG